MKKTALVLTALLLASCTLIRPTRAQDIEVVQSVPLETTLAVPGLRQTQEVWLEMIRSAQTSLDLEQFYVSNDAGQALEPVLEAIQAAASRGVRVRLLADAKMDKTYPDSIAQVATLPGAESRLIDFSSQGGIQHAKFFVVDGAQAFVGSQNFDWRALSHIHEIGLRVADAKVCSDLEAIFGRDWAQASRVQAEPSSSILGLAKLLSLPGTGSGDLAGVSVVASPEAVNPAGIPDSLGSITQLITSARHSVSVQVMEYTTSVYGQQGARWRALDDALRAAASRGAQVRLLVDVSDVRKAKSDLVALSRIPGISVEAVTIPAWSGGAIDFARLIHSKYVVIDSGAAGWVGSENWSEGYFMNTRDVGLRVDDAGTAGKLAQVFDRVWSSSYAAAIH